MDVVFFSFRAAECDSAGQYELLVALNFILKQSANLVQIFISSRDDGDIVCHLVDSPNVFIRANDSELDIGRFIHTKMDQAIRERRMVKGKVSEHLKARIIKTLLHGAQGM